MPSVRDGEVPGKSTQLSPENAQHAVRRADRVAMLQAASIAGKLLQLAARRHAVSAKSMRSSLDQPAFTQKAFPAFGHQPRREHPQ
jgi:hypothetical protein